MTPAAPLPRPLDDYRSWLHCQARAQLHPGLGGRIDASDLVQQSLLEAHRDAARFGGQNAAQQAAWLRRILATNLANAVRDLRRAKRDPARERSLDAACESSELGLAELLAADGATPSEVAVGKERVLELSAAVEQLPGDQQDAVLLRYWRGLSLAEIAGRMERSEPAVAGLLHRGLAGLRKTLARLDPGAPS